jgi:hypothetical protein
MLVGVVLALQVWTSLNGGAVATIGLLLLLPVAIWIARRRNLLRFGLGLAFGGAVAGIAVSPLVANFVEAREIHGISVKTSQPQLWSADVKSFFTVPTDFSSYPWHRALSKGHVRTPGWGEKVLYPGVITLAFSILGLRRLWRRRDRALALGALSLVFGALVIVFGPSAAGVTLPYGWAVKAVPFAANLRVPTRVWMLGLLGLGGLAAMAFPLRKFLAVPLLVLLFLEYLAAPIPLVDVPEIPQGYRWIAKQEGTVLELPSLIAYAGDDPESVLYDYRSVFSETIAMHRQTAHWLPLANGYSSYFPHAYLELMREVASFPSPSALEALSERGVRWVVVHPSELVGTPWEGLEAKLEELPIRHRSSDFLVVEVNA